MTNISPTVSVIIPLYNAENFIGSCLESILNQTFKDFEVIVVDDCSTDNSVRIVKSYESKFDGRLKLAHMEKNSGSGALPRNKGLKLSRGEYIFFIDNDDLITKTALEELYNLAKNYDAEVVQCEKNYRLSADTLTISQSSELISKPKFETEDLRERIHKILQNNNYMVPQWTKFVRRDFIFENELFFPNTRHGDDIIWTWALVIYAKKFLRVPNAVYCQRLTKNSILQKERTPLQEINFWLNPVILALNQLDKFMSKTDFFQKNIRYRYAVLENFVHVILGSLFECSLQKSPAEIYDGIKQSYDKNLGEQNVLISFLLADLIEQQKIFVKNQARIAQLEQKTK